MLNKIIHDALMIWVTIEPIGSVVLFAALTSRLSPTERRKTATKAIAYSAIILFSAILIGQIILTAMDIRLISLQIAGGIILFLFGLQMIFGRTSTAFGQSEDGHDIAVFPLAIPSIVGPEAIMVVILLTDNYLYSVKTQAITAGVMLVVLAVTYVLMLLAERLLSIIGGNGAAILERIMGIILATLSVDLIIDAFASIAQWTIPKL
ncbi:MarC family protein [Methylobacter sp.]|uniref:MarC family protein n=1 Tax=Methylobacter sp. TaxID=2051955 RepID=UPI002FDD3466